MIGAGESQPQADGLQGRRRLAAIAALSSGTMIATLDSGSLNIALPTLARELGVPPSSAVLLVTVYQLVLIMTVLPFSALGDRIGHRKLYLGGQVLYIAATLFCFVADSLPLLVAIRATQALGAAATFSVGSAMIRAIYPRAALGRGMAFNTVIAASSASLAPSLGGVILSFAHWPWLFALGVPFGLLSILIGRKALPATQGHAEPYDGLAALMCAVTFGTIVAGLESAVHGSGAAASATLIVCALVIGTLFVRREARQARPVFPVDLLRDRQIALSSIGALAASVASQVVLLTLPFRMQHQYHYTPVAAGFVLAAWPVATTLSAPLSGLLSDRLPAGLLGTLGMGCAVTGLGALAFLPADPDQFDVIWRVLLTALGFGAFYAPNARQVIFAAPHDRTAAAGGLTQTTRMGGQVLGSTLAATLLALGIGDGAPAPLIAAALGAAAGLCSILLLGASTRRSSR
jgi:DHA2 family multidrug resistance protein-like MFS transporter